MISYKEALTRSMTEMAKDPLVCFVGYGVKKGRAAGTLKDVPEAQLIETPVAENLMAGLAIGLSLTGRRPVVYIERFDFILNALDAIVNHLDKFQRLSKEQFSPAIILRVVAGNKNKPLFTGLTHTQDFTDAMRKLVTFPVERLESAEGIEAAYSNAHASLTRKPPFNSSTMLVELKDLI